MTTTKTLTAAYDALSSAIVALQSCPTHCPVEELQAGQLVMVRQEHLTALLGGRIRKGTCPDTIAMSRRLVARAEEVVEARRDKRSATTHKKWEDANALTGTSFNFPANTH